MEWNDQDRINTAHRIALSILREGIRGVDMGRILDLNARLMFMLSNSPEYLNEHIAEYAQWLPG